MPAQQSSSEVFENGQALAEARFDGDLDHFTLRVDHEAAHARQLLDLVDGAARARIRHHPDGVEVVRAFAQLCRHGVGGVFPDGDDGVVALFILQQAAGVLLFDVFHAVLRFGDERLFGFGDVHVEHGGGQRADGRILEAERLDVVEHFRRLARAALGVELGDGAFGIFILPVLALAARLEAAVDDLGDHLFIDGDALFPAVGAGLVAGDLVLEIVFFVLPLHKAEILRDRLVVDDAPHGGLDAAGDRFAVVGTGGIGNGDGAAYPDLVLQGDALGLIGHDRLVFGDVQPRTVLLRAFGAFGHFVVVFIVPAAVVTLDDGQVVGAEDHVLRGGHDRLAVGELQDVVGREHQKARFRLRLDGEGHVHGHLVAVEVGVEGAADERVDLDRPALDEHGLERLDGQAVQRGRAVEKDGVLFDDAFQHVPNGGLRLFDGALGALDVVALVRFDQLFHDEGLEQLDRHLFGQAALIDLQFGADDDDRTAGIVDALAQQVLTEAPLLAAQKPREGLELAVGRAGDGLAAAAVVDEGVHRFLQHTLLVFDDHVGRTQLHQPL